MLLSPKRIGRGLAPQRFSLCRSCTTTKEIGFSRPSSMPRLYEQLHVCGQGKHGEAVYATTAISASPNWINDDCVTIVDQNLMFALEHDAHRHWTVLSDMNDAKSWESQLVQLADGACTRTTEEYGPLLAERLEEPFTIYDRYADELGGMTPIFGSEFRFIDDATDREQQLVDLWSIGKGDDWRLACHLLIRNAPKLLPDPHVFLDSKLHECAPLRTLLYLMTDRVTACRPKSSTSERCRTKP